MDDRHAQRRSRSSAPLEPIDELRKLETEFNFSKRLALLEELKTAPFGPVWDYYCEKNGAPVGEKWIAECEQYEKDVLSKRG